MTSHAIQNPAQLAAHLRSLRMARGLTQQQLGEIVGLHQTRIARIERNPGAVSMNQLIRILSALDMQVVLQARAAKPDARAAKSSSDW